jgi:NAD(P)H-hydrate epimerase
LFCGQVKAVDIGISVPDDVTFNVESVESVSLPRRKLDAHKGNFGRVLIIAGSTSYTGAPSFASHAAVRSGAGLVFLGVPKSIYQIEAIKNDEAMVFPLPCDENGILSKCALPQILEKLKTASVCLIGPGLGRSEDVTNIVMSVLENSEIPVILDADGINAISSHIDVLDRVSCPVILTPHDGEFARLGGDLTAGRLSAACEFSRTHGITLVLKGYHTITAFPDGTAKVNTTGGPGMAKGGSGDVLSGMVAALTAQFSDLRFSVPAAVYLHGKAGDLCSEKFSEYSMTPSDVIDAIKYVTR